MIDRRSPGVIVRITMPLDEEREILWSEHSGETGEFPRQDRSVGTGATHGFGYLAHHGCDRFYVVGTKTHCSRSQLGGRVRCGPPTHGALECFDRIDYCHEFQVGIA